MRGVIGMAVLSLTLACGDTASVANDQQSMDPAGDPGGENGSTGSSAGNQANAGVDSSGGSAGQSSTGGSMSGSDADANTGEVAGEGGTAEPLSIAGTGTDCNSYTEQTDTQCGSYYCGVDLAMLTDAIAPGAKCGDDPAYVCKATLPLVVGACARKIKSANPLSSPKDLRPQVRDCAYEDAEVKEKVSDECLGCYLDSAECAGEKCLVECLAGDSPGCDACRLTNNCTQPVFGCNGLPNPL